MERLTIETLVRGADRMNRNGGGIGTFRCTKPDRDDGWYTVSWSEDFTDTSLEVSQAWLKYDKTPGFLQWKDNPHDMPFVVQADAEVLTRLLLG